MRITISVYQEKAQQNNYTDDLFLVEVIVSEPPCWASIVIYANWNRGSVFPEITCDIQLKWEHQDTLQGQTAVAAYFSSKQHIRNTKSLKYFKTKLTTFFRPDNVEFICFGYTLYDFKFFLNPMTPIAIMKPTCSVIVCVVACASAYSLNCTSLYVSGPLGKPVWYLTYILNTPMFIGIVSQKVVSTFR